MRETVYNWVIDKFGSIENMCSIPMIEMESRISFSFFCLPPNPEYTYGALDEVKRLRKEYFDSIR